MAILRSAIALSLFATVFVAACQPEGRTFQTTLRTEFNHPLPVTLTDETGLVTGITQAAVDPAMGSEAALRADPGDPNTSILTWTGGACGQDAAVRFGVQNGGYLLNVSVHGSSANCPASAVPRAIRIATSRAIPIASVTVAGG